MAASNARALRGRRLARWMMAGGIVVVSFAAFFLLAAPIGPNAMTTDPGEFAWFPPVAGFVGIGLGFIWMIRIMRAKPEPDTRAWRYRRKL